MMLLLSRKKLLGSYFALISDNRRRFLPWALSTPTSAPSPEIPVKLRYTAPVPNWLIADYVSRTHARLSSFSDGSGQLPSTDTIQAADRSVKAVSPAATLLMAPPQRNVTIMDRGDGRSWAFSAIRSIASSESSFTKADFQ